MYLNGNNILNKISYAFSDLCIMIQNARESIKNIIQEYAHIGTERIVTDVVREYFIKNFSNKIESRFISEDIKKYSNIFKLPSINELNGDSISGKNTAFDVQLVQYYDNTNYYNIISDLPCTVIETKYLGLQEKISQTSSTE